MSFLFGLLCGLIILLVIGVFLRDPILKRVVGRTEASLEDVSGAVARLSAALASGDREATKREADHLTRSGAGWWAWSNFYRWVISTAIAILLAFGAFTGTVLLFEQTQRLKEQTSFMDTQTELMRAQTERLQEQSEAASLQSELMTLSLVADLRSQMAASIETVSLADSWARITAPDPGGAFLRPAEGPQCGLGLNYGKTLTTLPNTSTLAAIEELGRVASLRERVMSALRVLLLDDNDAISMASFVLLSRFGERPNPRNGEEPRRYRNLLLGQLDLHGAPSLHLTDVVGIVRCFRCFVGAHGSIISFGDGPARIVIPGRSSSRPNFNEQVTEEPDDTSEEAIPAEAGGTITLPMDDQENLSASGPTFLSAASIDYGLFESPQGEGDIISFWRSEFQFTREANEHILRTSFQPEFERYYSVAVLVARDGETACEALERRANVSSLFVYFPPPTLAD